MTFTEKHLTETYTDLFNGLSTISKIELVKNLLKLIETENNDVDINFYNSFGAFLSENSAAEMIADMKANRNFRDKQIEF